MSGRQQPPPYPGPQYPGPQYSLIVSAEGFAHEGGVVEEGQVFGFGYL